MIRSTRMEVSDILATYSGTYLQFKTRDQEGFYPAKIVSAENTRNGIMLFIEKLDLDVMKVKLNDPSLIIQYKWPQLGMKNYLNNAHFITRKAQRQWKRGFRLSQLHIKELDHNVGKPRLEDGNRGMASDIIKKRKLIETIYKDKFTPIDKAIEEVSSSKVIARAISPDLCISNHTQANKPLIIYHNTVIGTIKNKRIEIHPSLPHMSQMVQRVQNENNIRNI